MAIGGRTVTAPGGVEWHVGRQWLPWRMKRRKVDSIDTGGGNWDIGGADDVFGLILVVFAALVFVVLFATVIVPIVAMGLELILILLVFFWTVGARLVLRRPWTVRARAKDGSELTWKAKGYLRSGRVRDEAAEALARGEGKPHPAEALPATG